MTRANETKSDARKQGRRKRWGPKRLDKTTVVGEHDTATYHLVSAAPGNYAGGNPFHTRWAVYLDGTGWMVGPRGGLRKFKTLDAAKAAFEKARLGGAL